MCSSCANCNMDTVPEFSYFIDTVCDSTAAASQPAVMDFQSHQRNRSAPDPVFSVKKRALQLVGFRFDHKFEKLVAQVNNLIHRKKDLSFKLMIFSVVIFIFYVLSVYKS